MVFSWKVNLLKGMKSFALTAAGVAIPAVALYFQSPENVKAIPEIAAYAGLITGLARMVMNYQKNS